MDIEILYTVLSTIMAILLYQFILPIGFILIMVVKYGVLGRAILVEPPHRSCLWRFNYNTTINTKDDDLNCGGYDVSILVFIYLFIYLLIYLFIYLFIYYLLACLLAYLLTNMYLFIYKYLLFFFIYYLLTSLTYLLLTYLLIYLHVFIYLLYLYVLEDITTCRSQST